MDLREMLKTTVSLWTKQIELCKEAKKRQFGETAAKLWGFLGKSFEELYLETPNQDFKPRYNLSKQFIDVMIPHVYERMPHRLATPRRPPIPKDILELMPEVAGARFAVDKRDQLRAWLATWFLNYTSGEFNLDREVLTALPEALVKGRGVLFHEMIDAPVGLIPGSTFMSVDDLFADADAVRFHEANFIIRRRDVPAWRLEQQTGIPRARLRAVAKNRSNQQTATDEAGGASDEARKKADVCEVWEIFSRMGLGQKFVDWPKEPEAEAMGRALDQLGPNIHLMIMPGLEYPLNLRPEKLQDATTAEMRESLIWPIEFHEESHNPWPCSVLDFSPNPDNPWASSPLEAGLPMQVFIDHMYSWLMTRIKATSRTLYVVSESLQEEFKTAMESGLDQEMVLYTGKPGEDIDKLLYVLKYPPVNLDVWKIVEMVEQAFQRVTGLEPLLGGAEPDRAFRSATEVNVREQHVTNRPGEMKETVKSWLSAAAAKENQAARLEVHPDTISRIVGEPLGPSEEDPEAVYGELTKLWLSLMYTNDPAVAAADLSFSTEAGVSRRKNKAKQLEDMTQIVQTVGPSHFEYGKLTGDFERYNGIMEMISEALALPATVAEKLLIPSGPPITPFETAADKEAAKPKPQKTS